jgi:transposase
LRPYVTHRDFPDCDLSTETGEAQLDRERWVVERSLSSLHQYRRLRLRYERRADIHEAFLALACSLICLKQLNGSICYRS